MGNEFWVMATAVVILALIMLGVWCQSLVSLTGTRRVKMVALSFLLLIGMTLATTGAGFHVPTGHIDAAMGFSESTSHPTSRMLCWRTYNSFIKPGETP